MNKKAASLHPEGTNGTVLFEFECALKSHFSEREDVPHGLKNALRTKLHNSRQQQEKLRFVWLFVPCVLFAAAAIFLAVEMFFGMSMAIIISVGYYLVATVAGVAVLIFMLAIKEIRVPSM